MLNSTVDFFSRSRRFAFSGGVLFKRINRAAIFNIERNSQSIKSLVAEAVSKHFLKEENHQGLLRKLAASKCESPQPRIMRYAREEDYNGAGIDFGRSDNMGQMGSIP